MSLKSYTLFELAELTESTLEGNKDIQISGVNNLDEALPSEASFLANPRYNEAMKSSQAGVICIDGQTPRLEGKNYLISAYPDRTFQKIAEILLAFGEDSGFKGVHPSAIIHESAQIGDNVIVGPHAVIEQNAKIGDRSIIGASCFVGIRVQVGTDCILHPTSVVRERCVLGNHVTLQPGAIIGSCGFGFSTDESGHAKLQQIGNVVIEDDVEIGANTTVDRARFKTTLICRGTKIDNLVQIAHNVEIGEGNLIAAQTGVAGSAKTGKYVLMGGQVGVLGHVKVGDNVMLATRSGVSKSLLTAGPYRGSPAIPVAKYNKREVYIRKIESLHNTVKDLEKRIAELEDNLDDTQES